MTEAEVRAELNRIVDPCSVVAGAPAGLIEMGLVRALAVSEESRGCTIVVRIGVTEPGCLMGASFAAQARERLEGLPGVGRVEIELDHEIDWDPSDIDPSYRDRLELVRRARRRALDRKLANEAAVRASHTAVLGPSTSRGSGDQTSSDMAFG